MINDPVDPGRSVSYPEKLVKRAAVEVDFFYFLFIIIVFSYTESNAYPKLLS